MKPRPKYNRIIQFITLALVVNFALANFVFAADPPPVLGPPAPAATSTKPVLDKKALEQANKSPEECLKLSKNISDNYSKDWKAVFWYGYQSRDSVKVDFSKGCYIVPSDWPAIKDGITLRNPADRNTGSYGLQDKIQYSEKGLTQEAFLTAKQQDDLDKQQASLPSKVVGWILSGVLDVVAAFLAVVAGIAGSIMDYAITNIFNIDYNTINIVNWGWTVVRDICNMFFILVLIVIALATILRIEQYDYKKLLKDVIIMALLVNFSKVIAITLIDIVNFVAAVFYGNGFSDIWSMVFNIVKPGTVYSAGNAGWSSALVDGLAKVLFMLVAVVSFIALSLLFVIRLVGLYVLVIFSPIAYVARILPATKKFSDDWWSHFIKYLIWFPVAIFMLRLTILIAKENGLQGFETKGYSAFTFVILSAFLWATIVVAQQAGMVGGDVIVNGVKKGGKLLGGAALGLVGRSYSKAVSGKIKAAEGAGNKGWARFWKTAQFANVRVAKEAWEARSKEKEEEAYLPAVGQAHDSLNRIMPTEWEWKKGIPRAMGQKTYYGRIGQRQLMNHKTKLWEEANLSEEEKVEAYNGVHHKEDLEALDTVLMLGRHEDGRAILTALAERKKRAETIAGELIRGGMSKSEANAIGEKRAEAEIVAEYDAVDDLDTITGNLDHTGLSEEQIGEILAHRDEVGEGETKLRGIGNAVYESDGKFRAANNFSGYQKLAEAKGTNAMLEELHKTGIFEVGNAHTVTDPTTGATVDVVDSLKFNGREFANFDEFQTVVNDTAGEDRASQNNLKYELTGARKQLSAQKRIERGDSEKWGQALEPAAFLVQNEHGKFTEFTSYGRRIFKNYSPANVNAFKKSRKLQARVLKAVGLEKNEAGTIDAEKVNYTVLSDAYKLNKDLAEAIMSKADLDYSQFEEIATKFRADVGTDMVNTAGYTGTTPAARLLDYYTKNIKAGK